MAPQTRVSFNASSSQQRKQISRRNPRDGDYIVFVEKWLVHNLGRDMVTTYSLCREMVTTWSL